MILSKLVTYSAWFEISRGCLVNITWLPCSYDMYNVTDFKQPAAGDIVPHVTNTIKYGARGLYIKVTITVA